MMKRVRMLGLALRGSVESPEAVEEKLRGGGDIGGEERGRWMILKGMRRVKGKRKGARGKIMQERVRVNAQ